jgi:hypothetical protein
MHGASGVAETRSGSEARFAGTVGVGGSSRDVLASIYGTPLIVVDVETIRRTIDGFTLRIAEVLRRGVYPEIKEANISTVVEEALG